MPCCLCLPFRLHYTTNTVQIGQVPSFFLSSWTLRFSISRLNDFEYSRGRVKEAALGKFCCSGKLNPIQQNLWSTAFELLLTFNLKLAEKLPEMRKLPKARYFHRIFAVKAQEMSRVKIIISNTSSPFFLAGSIIKIFWSIELNDLWSKMIWRPECDILVSILVLRPELRLFWSRIWSRNQSRHSR